MTLQRTPQPETLAPLLAAGTDELAAELVADVKEKSTVSKNPNAVAALASSQAALAIEALVAKYLGAHLGTFWSQEVIAASTVAVLYIGRNGLKRALGKIGATLKSVWTGPSS